MLKKWISILIVIVCIIPFAASAYTMDDIFWSLEREDGKTVLYLKGIRNFPSDGSYDLVVNVPADKIVFSVPYYVKDQYWSLHIDKLYIPSVSEYAVESRVLIHDDFYYENYIHYIHIIFMGNINEWPDFRNAYCPQSFSVTVNGTVDYIPSNAFFPDGYNVMDRLYDNVSLISNEHYTCENGVLEDSFTGMPIWASEENIFYEEPYYYMFNCAHDAVSILDYKGKTTEPEFYIPDTTKAGYPVRWISGPAIIAMNPYDFTDDLAKALDKLERALDQLDRWLAGGKKTEEQINRQMEKINELQAEYDALYEESLKTRYRNTLYLGQNIEAVSDFDPDLLRFDAIYVPATLTHYGKGLLDMESRLYINP